MFHNNNDFILAASRQNPFSGFARSSDTNGAVQPQKIVRDLKYRIEEIYRLYFLCNENKGTVDNCAFVFVYGKSRFSHDTAHFLKFPALILALPLFKIEMSPSYKNVA